MDLPTIIYTWSIVFACYIPTYKYIYLPLFTYDLALYDFILEILVTCNVEGSGCHMLEFVQ